MKRTQPFVTLIVFLLLVFMSPLSNAGPRWTWEASVGMFEPEESNWEEYYGSARMPAATMSFARRLFTVIDIGFSLTYGLDKGKGVLPISGLKAGNVTYEMAPIDVFIVLRGRFTENQWVVPYIGGGYTRFNYRQTIEDQGDTKGGVNGQHVRVGLQFLLDPLEKEAAREIYSNYGIINSYFFLEGKQTTAKVGDPEIDIGGISYNAGIMLEY